MSARAEAWPAPAKLNLLLHVVGRRADGYHLRQTAFQLVDLCDRLWIEPTRASAIRRPVGPAGVPEESDLAVRAARLLQRRAGVRRGAEIRIEKRIPAGGGLGGASSDAATVLVALDRLWGLDMGTEALAALGAELGADVPVFVRGESAWAEGVGERLAPLGLGMRWYAIVTPPVSVSTAEVFADAALTRDCPPITISDFLAGGGRNVCEPVVRRRWPVVGEALDWLGRRGAARLTGTGASVFAAYPDEAGARAALVGLPPGWRGFVARGLARSPLRHRARG